MDALNPLIIHAFKEMAELTWRIRFLEDLIMRLGDRLVKNSEKFAVLAEKKITKVRRGVEEPGLPRVPRTDKHAGSNPAAATASKKLLALSR